MKAEGWLFEGKKRDGEGWGQGKYDQSTTACMRENLTKEAIVL